MRTWGLILIAATLAALATQARALEITDVRWGFDDRVVVGRFTPVWFLVTNTSADLFEGTLTLHDDMLGRAGAAITAPIVVSPGSRRWVEFVPLVHNGGEQWTLTWEGTERGRRAIEDGPKSGPPARVALVESDFAAERAGIRGFPEEQFPASVTDLDTLDSVVLDHIPRWDDLQRRAFVGWLSKGGTVHVALGPMGHFPQFTDELGVLNAPSARARVGAGLVVHHNLNRRQLTEATLVAAGFPPGDTQSSGLDSGTVNNGVVQYLRAFTRPRHKWWLIFLLSGLYLLVIGPANWLVGRLARHFRLPILFLLAAILSFAWVFFQVGRRGYDEIASTYTLTEARPLADGTYDLTQWSSIFVTRGAVYDIAHTSAHSLYSTAGDSENIHGVIVNGKHGHFAVDIPLYSWRELIHRGQSADGSLPSFTLAAHGWTPLNRSGRLVLDAGPGFPKAPLAIWAHSVGADWYTMNRSADGAKLTQGQLVSINEQQYQYLNYGPAYMPNDDANAHANNELAWRDAKFVALAQILLARDTQSTQTQQFTADGQPINPAVAAAALTAEHDRIDVYVLVHATDALSIQSSQLGSEVGYVLIHQVVTLPED